MKLNELISPSRTLCDLEPENKKRVLETVANLMAKDCPDSDADELFNAYIARERLGSTGLGHGVAIPHVRVAGIQEPVCVFLKLNHGVNFDAEDGVDVDLVFALLAPEEAHEEHLQILAKVAKLFSNTEVRSRLRQCQDAFHLYEQLRGCMQQQELLVSA